MCGTLTNSGSLENTDIPPEDHAGDSAPNSPALQELKQEVDAREEAGGEGGASATEHTQEAVEAGDSEKAATVDDEPTKKLPTPDGKGPAEQQSSALADTTRRDEGPASGDASAREVEEAAEDANSQAAISSVRQAQHRRASQGQIAVLLLLCSLSIAGTVISGVYAISYGLNAYATYKSVRGQASAGVQHLLNVKTIFSGLGAHPADFFDASKLQRAQKELATAHQNFQQVEDTLAQAPIIATVNQYLPQFYQIIVALRAVSRIGVDVAEIGQDLIGTASVLAPTLRGAFANNSRAPLVTAAMLTLIGSTIDQLLPRLQDIQAQSGKFTPDQLPGVSQHERVQLSQLFPLVPQAVAMLTQARGLMGAAGWVLGVDAPRTFLVQTMDRAELRPTGGFTGQFGEISINAGRVAPFNLKDISLVEYTANSPTLGQQAPTQYRSWWPFANWGLRDSNLSVDFPTSAQIAINQYKSEVGRKLDGLVIFTPFVIEHVLQIIGPIKVPGYNDTITSQNLEERLHYYQQDSAGLARQAIVQPKDTSTSSRKRFTSLLAHLLLDHVRHASPAELIAIARQMLQDLKTKDLQVYVTNPQIEGLLTRYGDAATIDRSNAHDGLYVVQANISASKASQYVRTSMHDTVTLDSQGGARHVLQLRFVYNQVGPVYGYDTYHDYVRVYVPSTSKYLWGDGFDTGTPLCGATYTACPQRDVYPANELLCPAGQFQPGAEAPTFSDESGATWHPLDSVGPPTNLVSDEAGRAMFGGLVIIPKNCTMTVTLSWYVPGHNPASPYSLLVQRQAGTFPELDLTLLAGPGSCAALHWEGQHFDGLLLEDATFSIKTLPAQQRWNCYPQPGV